MEKTTLEMIAAISNANGTSVVFERMEVAAIRPYAEGLGENRRFCTAQYIRRKENNGKRRLFSLDAHSDEVGFMVQNPARTEHFALFRSEVGLITIFRRIKFKFRNRFRRIYSGNYCQQTSAFHDRTGA